MVQSPTVPRTRILVPGRNCWRLVQADRLAFLVDGEAYFTAFKEAVSRAERQILILGWDLHSLTRLSPGKSGDAWPDELGPFLDAVVSRRGGPEAYVLNWDWVFFYALERERAPREKFGRRTHHRLHFELDGNHPPGASHHQKVVVVDDAVAFVGGLDLTKSRWDTPEHRADDPRRARPDGTRYQPFHDLQVAVSGEAAAALGDLARERWLRATGERIMPPRPSRRVGGRRPRAPGDPWPPGVAPALTDVTVGIARTVPEWEGRPAVTEVEALHVDAIAAARTRIYIENQYLTSARVEEAMTARLLERGGPEVVIVVPKVCSGWLEEATMGVARARLLERLRRADRELRLRVYYPVVEGLEAEGCVNVHSKLLVVDDSFVRAGSANASNRSMRLDTECDVALEADGDPRVSAAIGRLRDTLVAEHLGATPEAVAAAVQSTGSLLRAIDALRQPKGRRLEPLESENDVLADHLLPDNDLLDLERPATPAHLAARVLGDEPPARRHRLWAVAAGLLALLVAVIVAGRLIPDDVIDVRGLIEWARSLDGTPLAPLVVAGIYVVGGALMVPLLLRISVTGLVFGPVSGFGYALVGGLVEAGVFYAVGRLVGRERLRRWTGGYLERVSRKLRRHGVVTVAAIRMLPVAPFLVVNLLGGALHVPFRDYLFGTLIGLAPGTFTLVVLGATLADVLREPGPASVLALGGALLLVAAGLVWKRLRGRRDAGRVAAQAGVGQPARD
jgi:phosphatidylserine/phosphatidylglycerophosphate/cardiolipin synthase-like enzyme/uncharacterized membrane protein YdjX (TVP38/TMEM64 family)